MKGMLIFIPFHLIGGGCLSLGTIGLAVNLLCYLCDKNLLFSTGILLWLTFIGFITEIVGFLFAALYYKN